MQPVIRCPTESSCFCNHMFTVCSGKANPQLRPMDSYVIVAGQSVREKVFLGKKITCL